MCVCVSTRIQVPLGDFQWHGMCSLYWAAVCSISGDFLDYQSSSELIKNNAPLQQPPK